jgi:hypothetical protein
VSLSWGEFAIHGTAEHGKGWEVPHLELVAALLGLILWGKHLNGAIIRHRMDATGATHWGNSLRARDPAALFILKCMSILSEKYNITYILHWVPRIFNHLNDRAASTDAHGARAIFKHVESVQLKGSPVAALTSLLKDNSLQGVVDIISTFS